MVTPRIEIGADAPVMSKAACRGHDPSLWFPQPGGGADQDTAVRICRGCPHRRECAEWGIRHELHGIWGALTARERRRIRAQRGIRLVTLDRVVRR